MKLDEVQSAPWDTNETALELKLMKDVLLLDLIFHEAKITPMDEEIVHVRMLLEEAPEILSSCAWGLIFAIGALSFEDARPRGYSENNFVADDRWSVSDMLEHLSFENGRLHSHADYVRGRCVKTTVDVDREGQIVVETANRGEALTRWISKLQGKKTMGSFRTAPTPPRIPSPLREEAPCSRVSNGLSPQCGTSVSERAVIDRASSARTPWGL